MIRSDIAVVRFSADECRKISEALRMVPGKIEPEDLFPIADELEALSIGLGSVVEQMVGN